MEKKNKLEIKTAIEEKEKEIFIADVEIRCLQEIKEAHIKALQEIKEAHIKALDELRRRNK